MLQIAGGMEVQVRDSQGRAHIRIAVSGVTRGRDFLVVWACHPEEWQAAQAAEREPEAVPWPAEDVEAL